MLIQLFLNALFTTLFIDNVFNLFILNEPLIFKNI